MLTEVPANPRYMVFMLRSYTGSRQHLIVAAAKMLLESRVGGDPKEHGKAHDIRVLEAGAGRPEHFIVAASYYTKATIQDAVTTAAEIERKLEDPQRPGSRETIRIDLVWVQGAELKTPAVTLPHPELWSNGNWAHAWRESIGNEAIPDDSEALRLRDVVENATPKQKVRGQVGAYLEEALALYRKPGQQYWKGLAYDVPDALAMLGNAVPTAVLEREADLEVPRAAVDPALAAEIEKLDPIDRSEAARAEGSATVQRGLAAVRKRMSTRLDEVVPLRLKFNPDALAMQWASEVQATARQNKLRVGMVVVTSMERAEVHGLLLGQRLPEIPVGVQILAAQFQKRPGFVKIALETKLSTGQLFH